MFERDVIHSRHTFFFLSELKKSFQIDSLLFQKKGEKIIIQYDLISNATDVFNNVRLRDFFSPSQCVIFLL